MGQTRSWTPSDLLFLDWSGLDLVGTFPVLRTTIKCVSGSLRDSEYATSMKENTLTLAGKVSRAVNQARI